MQRAAIILCLLALAAPALAQDDWGDDVGFGEGGDDAAFDFEVPDTATEAPPPPSDWSLIGFARSDVGLWVERFDDNPFAKARQSLDLQFDWANAGWRVRVAQQAAWDAAYLYERDTYDDATLRDYELRFIGGEQFVAYAAGPVEVTLGRQIVAWGEGDVLSPLDVVNPRDLREPGLADLDDLRLSVLASRVGVFFGAHRFEIMGIHEAYYGERPPPLAPFSPFASVIAGDPTVAMLLAGKSFDYEHDPSRFDLEGHEVLGRWVYKGPGLDAGLHVAWVRDDQGVVVLPTGLGLLAQDHIDVRLEHRRYLTGGLSAATAFGDWVLKWEVAGELDRAYNSGDVSAAIPMLDVDEIDTVTAMMGATWRGVTDLTVGVEAQRGIVVDGPDDLLFPVDAPIGALRVSYVALRERLLLAGAVTAFGLSAQYGWLARGEATWELTQGLDVGVGYVHYGASEEGEFGPFAGFDDHDRAFAKLRWDFVIH